MAVMIRGEDLAFNVEKCFFCGGKRSYTRAVWSGHQGRIGCCGDRHCRETLLHFAIDALYGVELIPLQRQRGYKALDGRRMAEEKEVWMVEGFRRIFWGKMDLWQTHRLRDLEEQEQARNAREILELPGHL